MNLIEEAYLKLLAPAELYPIFLAPEDTPRRRGIIRTILVWLTLFTLYNDLRSMLPDLPPSGPRPVKASPLSMSGSVRAGVNRTIPTWSTGS